MASMGFSRESAVNLLVILNYLYFPCLFCTNFLYRFTVLTVYHVLDARNTMVNRPRELRPPFGHLAFAHPSSLSLGLISFRKAKIYSSFLTSWHLVLISAVL